MLPSRRISAAEGFAKIQKILQKLFDNEKFFKLFNNELNEGNESVLQRVTLTNAASSSEYNEYKYISSVFVKFV